MAVNFPDAPSNGDSFSVNDTTYVYNATAGYWDITSTVQASASTGTNAPSNPSAGDFWFDPSSLTTYIYYYDGTSSQWIPANSVGARGAPGPGYPTSYYSLDYTSTTTGNVVFNSSSTPTLPSYTVGKVNAWVNGVLRSDINASDGSNVEISLSTGDEVQIINFGDTDVLDPTASSNDHTTYTTLSSLIDTVQANVTSAGSGVAVYATPDLLPLSGINSGEQAYVNSTNRLYINNGTGWYSIGLVNNNPSITSVQDASAGTTPFTLAIDGSATVITITASDPEDVPLTYSYAVTSGSLTNGGGTTATVVQGTGANTNKFTITPSATEAYAGTFELTFTASDGINTATNANSFTLSFITIITNSKYTTLLATATDTSDNNNITDASSNNHSITVNGDAHAGTFSPYRHGGYSTYFDGNDFLQNNDGTGAGEVGSGAFCIEAWVYKESNGSFDCVCSLGTAANSYQFEAGNGNDLVQWETNNGPVLTSTTTLNLNQWYHVAVSRDSSNNIRLYVDGTKEDQTTNTEDYRDAGPFEIARNRGGSQEYHGYIRDLRIVVGDPVYTADTITVPTDPLTAITNTNLLACHLPYIADGSTNNWALNVNGNNVSTKPFSPYDYLEYSAADHGGSVFLGGTAHDSEDRLEITRDTSLTMGSGDFTYEAWVYLYSENVANEASLFSARASGYESFVLKVRNSGTEGTNLLVSNSTGTGWSVVNTKGGAVFANVWTHVAIVRSGTSIKVYTNGKEAQSHTFSGSLNEDNNTLYIGYDADSRYGLGHVSDVRITKGTAVYTTEFTPPTAPLSSSGAALHIKGTDASIIDKSQGANLKLEGNTTGSTTQVKFSNTKSMYFNGTGGSTTDYVTLSSNSSILGSGDFTVELWLYPSSIVSGYRCICSQGSGGTSLRMFVNNTNIQVWSGASRFIDYNNSTTANTWYHIAYSHSSSGYSLYVDGSLAFNYGSEPNLDRTLTSVNIGGGDASSIDGYIQDFRITKGLARYTANFTPPTAPLEG